MGAKIKKYRYWFLLLQEELEERGYLGKLNPEDFTEQFTDGLTVEEAARKFYDDNIKLKPIKPTKKT